MGHVVLDVQTLDGIGGVGIVDAENIAQRAIAPPLCSASRSCRASASEKKSSFTP